MRLASGNSPYEQSISKHTEKNSTGTVLVLTNNYQKMFNIVDCFFLGGGRENVPFSPLGAHAKYIMRVNIQNKESSFVNLRLTCKLQLFLREGYR